MCNWFLKDIQCDLCDFFPSELVKPGKKPHLRLIIYFSACNIHSKSNYKQLEYILYHLSLWLHRGGILVLTPFFSSLKIFNLKIIDCHSASEYSKLPIISYFFVGSIIIFEMKILNIQKIIPPVFILNNLKDILSE